MEENLKNYDSNVKTLTSLETLLKSTSDEETKKAFKKQIIELQKKIKSVQKEIDARRAEEAAAAEAAAAAERAEKKAAEAAKKAAEKEAANRGTIIEQLKKEIAALDEQINPIMAKGD